MTYHCTKSFAPRWSKLPCFFFKWRLSQVLAWISIELWTHSRIWKTILKDIKTKPFLRVRVLPCHASLVSNLWNVKSTWPGSTLVSTFPYFFAFSGVKTRYLQWGSWKNTLNWRKIFKCLNFIWQTWYLKFKLFTWCFCPWVFWLLWIPKNFFEYL